MGSQLVSHPDLEHQNKIQICELALFSTTVIHREEKQNRKLNVSVTVELSMYDKIHLRIQSIVVRYWDTDIQLQPVSLQADIKIYPIFMGSQIPNNQAEIKNVQNKKRQKRRSLNPIARQPLRKVDMK